MTTTGRGKDVAWGFFRNYAPSSKQGRFLRHFESREMAESDRKICMVYPWTECTPVFKITEPRTEIRAGRGGRKKK